MVLTAACAGSEAATAAPMRRTRIKRFMVQLPLMLATVMLATSQCRSGWRTEQSANDRAEGPLWVRLGHFGDVGSMSGLLKSGHGWAIVHALAPPIRALRVISQLPRLRHAHRKPLAPKRL